MIPDSLRYFAAEPNYNETNLPKCGDHVKPPIFNKYRIIGCDVSEGSVEERTSPSERSFSLTGLIHLYHENYKASVRIICVTS